MLAYHFAQAEEWPRAQAYLFKAGEQAGRIAADAEALEHYQATLRAAAAASGAPDRVQRAGLEGRIAEALFRLGRHDVALEHAFSGLAMLGIVLPASGKGIRAAIARKVLARARRRVMKVVSVAPARVRPADAAHVAATQLFEVIGHVDYYRHPPRFVLGILTMLEHAETRPPSRALVVGTAALGLICDSLGLPRFARKLHARAGYIGEALGDDLALGYCYNLRGLSEYGAGDWRASLATQEMAAARCEAAGHLRLWASSIAGQYFVLRSMGDARWIALMARQQEVAVAIGDAHALAWVTNTQGVAALYRGDPIAAEGHFARACEAYEAIPDYRFLAGSLARRAYCRVLAGEMDHAFRLIGQCEDLIKRHHIRGIAASAPVLYVAEAYLCAAQSHPDAGERRAALRKAGPACARAIHHGRRTGDESAAEALRLAGTYAWLSGRRERALRNWKQGIAVADRKGANHALAKLHHEIALRTGDATHAQAAKEWFDKTGSAPVERGSAR